MSDDAPTPSNRWVPVGPSVELPAQDLKLVVNVESWHFKYFKFIRRQWGFKPPNPQTSLCPYCQTMFWGSVAMASLGVFIIMGWLEIRLGRLLYKLLPKRLMVWLSPGAEALDRGSKAMENSFAMTAFAVAMFSTICAGILFFIFWLIFWVGWQVLLNIPQLPELLWTGLLHVGWVMFYVLAGIGWCIVHAWKGLVSFFTNGPLWITIAMCFGIGLGALVALAMVGYGAYMLVSSNMMKRLAKWAVNKFNGFKTARELTAKAKSELEIARRAKKNEPVEPTGFRKWWASLWSYELNLAGAAARMVGPLGILWAYIKAVKKNVCPLVSFVNADGTPIENPERIRELEHLIQRLWDGQRGDIVDELAKLKSELRKLDPLNDCLT